MSGLDSELDSEEIGIFWDFSMVCIRGRGGGAGLFSAIYDVDVNVKLKC